MEVSKMRSVKRRRSAIGLPEKSMNINNPVKDNREHKRKIVNNLWRG